MNSCILIAEIIEPPQLRHTQENMAIAEMKIQIPGLRPDEPASVIKVVGWGNLAQEMPTKYSAGDQVVIEGRLGMNTVERPEGFKEKLAELTATKIYPLVGGMVMNPPAIPMATSGVPSAAPANTAKSTASKAKKAVVEEPDFDDIPF
jgi:single-strand DNA-binding protein